MLLLWKYCICNFAGKNIVYLQNLIKGLNLTMSLTSLQFYIINELISYNSKNNVGENKWYLCDYYESKYSKKIEKLYTLIFK